MKTIGKPIGIALIILMMISVQAFAQSNGNGGNGNGPQAMAKNTQAIGTGGSENGGNAFGVHGTDEGGFGNGIGEPARIRERELERARERARLMTMLLNDVEVIQYTEVCVKEVLYPGSALVIDTDPDDPDNQLITVYGIGPEWYWDDVLEIAIPDCDAGTIDIEVLVITFIDGTERIIATTIDIPGEEPVVLRDEYGWPAWRQVGYGLGQ